MPFVVSPSAPLRADLSNYERPFDKLRANGITLFPLKITPGFVILDCEQPLMKVFGIKVLSSPLGDDKETPSLRGLHNPLVCVACLCQDDALGASPASAQCNRISVSNYKPVIK